MRLNTLKVEVRKDITRKCLFQSNFSLVDFTFDQLRGDPEHVEKGLGCGFLSHAFLEGNSGADYHGSTHPIQ